jgi:hypothetical protein
MHNLFLEYLVNLYMFRAYLVPLSWLDWIQSNQDNREHHLKRIISTNCCLYTVVPPDDGPRYARNM